MAVHKIASASLKGSVKGYRKNRDSNGKRRCPSGKVIYGSRGEVQKALDNGRWVGKSGLHKHPQEAYSCKQRKRWHLTSMTPEQSQAWLERQRRKRERENRRLDLALER